MVFVYPTKTLTYAVAQKMLWQTRRRWAPGFFSK